MSIFGIHKNLTIFGKNWKRWRNTGTPLPPPSLFVTDSVMRDWLGAFKSRLRDKIYQVSSPSIVKHVLAVSTSEWFWHAKNYLVNWYQEVGIFHTFSIPRVFQIDSREFLVSNSNNHLNGEISTLGAKRCNISGFEKTLFVGMSLCVHDPDRLLGVIPDEMELIDRLSYILATYGFCWSSLFISIDGSKYSVGSEDKCYSSCFPDLQMDKKVDYQGRPPPWQVWCGLQFVGGVEQFQFQLRIEANLIPGMALLMDATSPGKWSLGEKYLRFLG